jgi:CBS domain-containing membrane protein
MNEKGLRVRDLMSKEVATLGRNDQLRLADDLMSQKRIRHLVVLGPDDEVAGIVSQRDLFRGALAKALGYGSTAQQKVLDLLLVKEVMATEVTVVEAEAPLAAAARLLTEKKIGCLPVVEGEKLVGILTESDFVKLALAP